MYVSRPVWLAVLQPGKQLRCTLRQNCRGRVRITYTRDFITRIKALLYCFFLRFGITAINLLLRTVIPLGVKHLLARVLKQPDEAKLGVRLRWLHPAYVLYS